MATQNRDDQGRFSETLRDQDILKAFDFEATADDPYLTVSEVTDALAHHWDIDVTDEAVRQRLESLRDNGTVTKRRFGPGVAYKPEVGPELSEAVTADSEAVADEYDHGETTSHDDLWDRLE